MPDPEDENVHHVESTSREFRPPQRPGDEPRVVETHTTVEDSRSRIDEDDEDDWSQPNRQPGGRVNYDLKDSRRPQPRERSNMPVIVGGFIAAAVVIAFLAFFALGGGDDNGNNNSVAGNPGQLSLEQQAAMLQANITATAVAAASAPAVPPPVVPPPPAAATAVPATATPRPANTPTAGGAPATATPPGGSGSGSGVQGSNAPANTMKNNRILNLSDADVRATGSFPNLPRDISQGGWEIKTTADITTTDPIVDGWLKELQAAAPLLWPTYPNIPNPKVPGFRSVVCKENPAKRCVPDGAEYGVANVPFCQQDMRCDFVVPARHYRLITCDYVFLGKRGAGNGGHLLLLFNVGGETMTWIDQRCDNGFTVPGRYWNGGDRQFPTALKWAAWGLVSHASANMLNMQTTGLEGEELNAGPGTGQTNAGANCGIPEGCNVVHARIVVSAGDRILAEATTTIRPNGATRGY